MSIKPPLRSKQNGPAAPASEKAGCEQASHQDQKEQSEIGHQRRTRSTSARQASTTACAGGWRLQYKLSAGPRV